LSCNSCAGWNFESTGLENWRVDPGFAGSVQNVSWGGSRALSLRLENTGTRISAPLCPGAGISVDMNNRTMTMRIAFVSDPPYTIPTGPPLTIAFTGETPAPPIPGYDYWGGSSLTDGAYQVHTATVTTWGGTATTDLTRVVFAFDVGTGWVGTVYIDYVNFN
jgi:hypothetical protein